MGSKKNSTQKSHFHSFRAVRHCKISLRDF
nr:MAG TPA: hypothetical protein [Caudoviricetes sp.]